MSATTYLYTLDEPWSVTQRTEPGFTCRSEVRPSEADGTGWRLTRVGLNPASTPGFETEIDKPACRCRLIPKQIVPDMDQVLHRKMPRALFVAILQRIDQRAMFVFVRLTPFRRQALHF